MRDGAAERAEDILRQPRALHFFVERERPEFVGRLACQAGRGGARGRAPFTDVC